MFPGAEIRMHSQWNLGDYFPNFEKKSQSLKKFFFFLKIGIFIQSTYTHKLHGDVLLQFNGNSMCNSYFLLTKNDIIVHYNKFPNLGVYCANFFPNLKSPGAPSQNCKKKSLPPKPLGEISLNFTEIKLLSKLFKDFYFMSRFYCHATERKTIKKSCCTKIHVSAGFEKKFGTNGGPWMTQDCSTYCPANQE